MDHGKDGTGGTEPAKALLPVTDTPPMRRVLGALLEAHGELSNQDVIATTHLKRSTVSTVFRALVGARWVIAAPHGMHGRQNRLAEAARGKARELLGAEPVITLAWIREACEVSQAELAARTGWSRPSLRRFEIRRSHQLPAVREYLDGLDASYVTLRAVFDGDATLTEAATAAAMALLAGEPATVLTEFLRQWDGALAAPTDAEPMLASIVSKAESSAGLDTGTVRRWFEAFGGRVELLVEFADGETFTVTELG
jgi:DNA-binding IclR family transcriptional regulator